jgi:hypothetical protein
MPEQLPPEAPIRASLDKFAKQEAERHTTLGIEATKAVDGPAEATVTLSTAGSTSWFDWGVGAWVRRKFQRGGTSGGVKGEIKF